MCSKKEVDAEEYFNNRLKEIDDEMKKIQAQSKKKNIGIAFISFKEKSCV